MQQVYGNTSKVLIDNKGNGSMLYLPLDKLMQQNGAVPDSTAAQPAPKMNVPVPEIPPRANTGDSRTRERGDR